VIQLFASELHAGGLGVLTSHLIVLHIWWS